MLENKVVNLYGNTAIVTFVMHTCRKGNGISVQHRGRFYNVWINRKGKWLTVASQGIKVAE